TQLAEAALRYASRGWHICPCAPRGKEAITRRGFKDASADPEQVRRWWKQTPNANIGLVPARSGLLVLDLDGPEGIASANRLGLSRIATLSARTGRGRHLFFRHPGVEIGNRKLADGIDV